MMDNPEHGLPEPPNPFEAPGASDYRRTPGVARVLIVQGNRVIGTSPMKLPPICVLCGANAEDGELFQQDIQQTLSQPQITVQHYYCRGCVRKQKNWKRASKLSLLISIGGMWLSTKYIVFNWFVFLPFLILLLVFVGVTILMARSPLYVASYKKPCFYVGGFAPAFLREFARREAAKASEPRRHSQSVSASSILTINILEITSRDRRI